jgi:RNA polymerase sigma-70 factor (ECF subfamily)
LSGSEPQDNELMAAAGAGDERAFNRLVARHGPRIFAVARRYLGAETDAEEVTQEVFWRAWRAAPRWRPGKARLTTWLHAVTAHLAIDRGRRRRRRGTEPPEALEEIADAAVPQDARMGDRQELAAMTAAIAGLADRQRLALILSVQQGLANRDIAAALGLSEGAVEQLLVRARRRLRDVHRSLR